MNEVELKRLLEQTHLHVGIVKNGRRVDLPFLIILPKKADNFSADDIVYYKRQEYGIELYTEKRDIKKQNEIEEFLTQKGIYFEKIPAEHIDSEKMWITVYEIGF